MQQLLYIRNELQALGVSVHLIQRKEYYFPNYTAHFTLHTSHCTLHTAKLHTAVY